MTREQNHKILLIKAIQVAAEAHGNTMSKDGTPYILHPIRLMMKVDSWAEKIVAILHDTVEDTDVTLASLREWLPRYIVDAIDGVTRRRIADQGGWKSEDYEDFIERVSKNKISIRVKLADLYDNIDLTRLEEVGEYELQRAGKYHKAIKYLESALEDWT